ncbi:MAG: hypothetical protein EAZ32_16195 [Cytophagia bacterium]|nr:MAG: hypothetical protein EAZ38_00290 [Cytophagales bacterium]TAG37026.1 MAG: hypothetical protein EAZ32_16195 [Cytophagia bacterium]TAG84583.1 MAG: hypothetical protein EAZ22_00460 [Cytophagales bacterium]
MKNVETLLQDLLSEHDFLKTMQRKIVDNYDILAQNQLQNADNHAVVVQNQSIIIRNQEVIVNNQINIIKNQRQIVQNQVNLDVMLKTQAQLLNLVKKLSGEAETLDDTEAIIDQLRATSKENLRFEAFNNAGNL